MQVGFPNNFFFNVREKLDKAVENLMMVKSNFLAKTLLFWFCFLVLVFRFCLLFSKSMVSVVFWPSLAASSLSVPARPVVPRSHLSWLNFRTYSSFAGRPRTAQWPSRDQVARASLSLRYLWTRSSRMYHLEEDANSDPDDARAQADYLKVCL